MQDLSSMHRSVSLGIGPLVAASLLFLSLLPPAFSGEQVIGTVTALRGTVLIKRPGRGSPLSAREGTPIQIADVVEAGAGSAAQVAFSDESFVNMAPGASIRLNQYSFDEAKNRRTMIIKVLEGKVRCIVFRIRTVDSSFRVVTETALVTADLLADFVAIASHQQTEIAVLDHGLSVKNSLPYVVGDMRVGVNQRTVVREKARPAMPAGISSRERKEILKDVTKI